MTTFLQYCQGGGTSGGSPLGGVFGFGGMFVGNIDWKLIDTDFAKMTPIFVSLGIDDPFISPKFAENTWKTLIDTHGLDNIQF
jgi:predicted esterase